MVPAADLIDGAYRLPYLHPNRVYFARARPRLRSGTWGEWSSEQRLVTLRDVAVHLSEVGEHYGLVTWCRPHTAARDPQLKTEDMAVPPPPSVCRPLGARQPRP